MGDSIEHHNHMNHSNHGSSAESEKKEMAEDAMSRPSEEHEHQGSQNHAQHGHDHSGHDHSSMIDDFKKRFWISLIVSIPVILLSEMIQQWFGYTIRFPGDRYVLALLSTFIFFYGGWPFLKGLWDEVKKMPLA